MFSIIKVIIKNFNSHGHHDSKCRELNTHTHVDRPPKGGQGVSDVSPLSEISGLSVSSHFSISSLVLLLSPVALFVISFSPYGPFS